MIPGRRNRLALEPTRTGVFRGTCAEYCGTSHALMSFYAARFSSMPPAGWSVHVPAADDHLSAGYWCGHLAPWPVVYRDRCHRCRRGIDRRGAQVPSAGMRMNLIPLYSWYFLVAAAMVLFAFPPVIAGSLLLELERALPWPFFDPTRGDGSAAVAASVLALWPSRGLHHLPAVNRPGGDDCADLCAHADVGYGWIVLAAVGTGFLSFGLWVHHMFTTGLPVSRLGLFSAASEAVAIPTGVQIFCFLATLLVGRVTTSVPLLYVFGALTTFVLGGLTGVMVVLRAVRLTGARHVLRGGEPALRADRRRPLPSRRRLLPTSSPLLMASNSPRSWGGSLSGRCSSASISPSCRCT